MVKSQLRVASLYGRFRRSQETPGRETCKERSGKVGDPSSILGFPMSNRNPIPTSNNEEHQQRKNCTRSLLPIPEELISSLFHKAFFAKNWPAFCGLEWNFTIFAAFSANRFKHFPRSPVEATFSSKTAFSSAAFIKFSHTYSFLI